MLRTLVSVNSRRAYKYALDRFIAHYYSEPRLGLDHTLLGRRLRNRVPGGSSGERNPGTVFKLTPSGSGWTESVIYNVTGRADGKWPSQGLVQDAQGSFYGTALEGGAPNSGVVFQINQCTRVSHAGRRVSRPKNASTSAGR